MRLQVNNGVTLAAAVAVGLGLPAAPARALPTPDDESAGCVVHFFSDVNGVDVVSMFVDYGLATRPGFAANLEWSHDIVIIPAIDAPRGSAEAVDAITTASRPIADADQPYEDYVKTRDALHGSVAWKDVRGGYYVSNESDYFAQMVSLGWDRDLQHDNLNLAAGLSYGWDRIEPLADDGATAAAADRNTLHGSIVATRILDPRTTLRVGVEFDRVSGQQHDPYRSVHAGGAIVRERHPDERLRRDLFVRATRWLGNRSSLKADFRLYGDDWDVGSSTWGLRLSQYVTDELVVAYRYRYYTQSSAWFYSDDYAAVDGIDGFRTGDYRLGDFGAHLFGGRITWTPAAVARRWRFLDDVELVLGFERYFNSYNFTASIYETGVRVSF
ncbi:MAG: DUF3570 domain-containing protein [bacterium]|nr:DUF3570 domain-containing protein [bacterium]